MNTSSYRQSCAAARAHQLPAEPVSLRQLQRELGRAAQLTPLVGHRDLQVDEVAGGSTEVSQRLATTRPRPTMVSPA